MATTNSQYGLADLPVELVLHICSLLRPLCDTAQQRYPCRDCICRRPGCHRWSCGVIDVSRLSRTCRLFRDVAQPLVFHCYSDEFGGEKAARRLIRLGRTLLARPDLAQHMRFLMFSKPSLNKLDDEDTAIVAASVAQLGLPPVPSYWNIDGKGYHRLIPLEIVLASTPNLEYLRIPLDYDWNLCLVPQLLESRGPFLPKLRALAVEHYFIAGDRWDVSTDAVYALAQAAPSLEMLYLPSPSSGYRSSTHLPLANLRRLYFQAGCSIDPDHLESMLRSAPKLEVLAVHWNALADAYDYVDDRRVTDAWDAIELRKDSLREIRLDIRDDTEVGNGERDSLKDFRKLEVLKVNWHALKALRRAWKRKNGVSRVDSFLSAFFPPSIREVTFWALDAEEMTSAMLRFARVAAVGRYPNLDRVVLEPPEEDTDRKYFGEYRNTGDWRGVKDELEADFGEGGVRFELRWEGCYWLAGRVE